ncbi:sigma-70 family RNA polymerase sigma factor [Aurantibacter crassamenti]|uniref:RNA polymerase sigma factor n=1 Tax=Aurantibacter crassamenti TaxID=1837375 RepID=UPI001939610C|nr:sigma-70 family RNA polymerase sigma factor [Aurantibacter crassamenti]MBM1104948.1 sigma-70 family RNA polymerase sigma factor [Aurantibacter crassamenti]
MDKDLETTFLSALDEHQHKLLRICSVYAKDDDDTKDLFQEVLVNIWKSMPTFKGNSTIGTWMYRITLNVCLRLKTKEIKKQKKLLRLDSRAINFYKTETLDDKESEQREKLLQLRKCIKQLNEADKAVITLYLEALPYKEISSITGLTENTIAVKIKRIKSKLLNCIKSLS